MTNICVGFEKATTLRTMCRLCSVINEAVPAIVCTGTRHSYKQL
jgi:hypothetical protein